MVRKREFALLSLIFIAAIALRGGAAVLLPRHQGPDASEYIFVAEQIASYFRGETGADHEQLLKVAERRGWLYPLYLALMRSAFGQHSYLYLVGGFQILLDGLSCVLLYRIGKRLFAPGVALLASFLAAVYPGFIYYSKFISQETTVTFLLVLFVSLVISLRDHSSLKRYLVAGMVLGCITFYRPSYQFFFIPFLPLLLSYLRHYRLHEWRSCFVSFVAGLMMVISVWLAFSYTVGKNVILYTSSSWALYETLRNDGWVTDDYFPVVTQDLYDHLRDAGDTPPPLGTILGFDHDVPPSVYVTLSLRWIKDHPLQALSQMLKRVYRMWFYIETVPAKWHSPATGIQLFFHRSLIILSVIGISLSLAGWRSLWLVYLLMLYATCQIYAVGIPRYNVPSMPFVLLLASYAVMTVAAKLKKFFHPLHWRGVLWAGIFVASAVLFYSPFPVSIGALLLLAPSLNPEQAHRLIMVMGNVHFLAIALVVFLFLKQEDTKRAVYKASVFIVLTLPFLNNRLMTDTVWHEWRCALRDGRCRIVQKIVPPPDLHIGPATTADLFLDLMGGEGKEYALAVNINGKRVRYYADGLQSDREAFRRRFFGLYEFFFFHTYGLRPEDLRQWYRIPLDPEVLQTGSPIEIECYLGGEPDGHKNYVYLFGDYVTEHQKKERIYEGPMIPSTNQDTSLYKIMPYEGDSRFETGVHLRSATRESFFCKGNSCQATDLSDTPGLQQGTYRIQIRLLDGDTQTFL